MAPNAEFFDQHVPDRLLKALVKLVFENYKQSSRYCFRYFSPSVAKDLSGTHRRAKIEEDLAGIQPLFRGVVVAPARYENNTGSYNEITCGPVKLTQSCTIDRDEVPRQAKFRFTLAKNGQLSLFDRSDRQEASQQQSFLYAILTHGVDNNSPKRSWPAFVRIQFPNETCTEFVDEGIDLLARFPEIVAEYIPRPQVLSQPTKRRRAMAAGE